MDHLKELIKEYIEYQKSEFDCSNQTDEEIFDCVMENVVSMVEDYKFSDYSKQKGIVMEREYYIMEVEGEGCYCLCYDDGNGDRVVIDWDLEIRED